ncbi:MAG: aminotransferase class I/II-fold pyridoxal phosphate-dependent enzyme [Defluviitaleaceae bacterium]|nr:aminotransferase class I/II-fold pyridoxal phosphate-dependent enzyme [Defluviitaleaceae bacterium]
MKYLSEKAKRLTPYVAGLQPQGEGWIKLNTNENPYPPAPSVFDVLKAADIEKLRLYPDGESGILKSAIGAALCVGEDYVFCANSSDEVLALAFQAFFSGKNNVKTADISYGFYPVWGQIYDVGLDFVSVGSDFSISPDDYKNAEGVVIANPNAPTSLALGLSQVEKIVATNPDAVVVLDEAYIDFARVESAVALVQRYKNLLVTRTFSKSHSLAGLRVGYAIGDPMLIDGLCRVRDAFNSYPLDKLAQLGAAAAISNPAYLRETCAKIIDTREKTISALQNLGFEVLPSQANFIFMQATDAGILYEYLLQNKIIARHWNKPRVDDYLRVSIGTENDMEVFVTCVKQYLNERQKKQV